MLRRNTLKCAHKAVNPPKTIAIHPVSVVRRYNKTNYKYEDIGSFVMAASKGDLQYMTKFIAEHKDFDLNQGDYDHRTALHLAAAEGKLDVVKFLVEKGASVNITDRFENTPTQDALRGQRAEVVDYLISKGGKSLLTVEKRFNSALRAITSGNLAYLKLIFRVNPELQEMCDFDKKSLLHVAASIGNLEIVKYLVEKGCDVNVLDDDHQPPISDAINNNHEAVVNYLLKCGASLPNNSMKIIQTPEFSISLKKSLPILCERGKFQYADVWIPQKGGRTLGLAPDIFYGDEKFQPNLSSGKFRSSFEGLVYKKKDQSIISKTWTGMQPVFLEKIKDGDLDNFDALKTAGVTSILSVPIIHENDLLAIVLLYSAGEARSFSPEAIRKLTDYAKHLIVAGIPQIVLPSKPKYEVMDKVVATLSKESSFDATHIYYEAEHFFNALRMPEDYFAHFTGPELARHLNCLIAAKRVALVSGNMEEISFVNEQEDSAIYICSAQETYASDLESKIEAYLLATPASYGYSLESYQSEGPISPNGKESLMLYYVKRHPFPPTPKSTSRATDIHQLVGPEFFKFKNEASISRYQELIVEAQGRLMPVLKHYSGQESKIKGVPVFMAFENSISQVYLRSISELVDSFKGMNVSKRYIETFSNGLVVYCLYITPEKDEDIQALLNSASLLSIIPPTKLYDLFLNGKFTARQLMYAFSVMKFCYYFNHRSSEEYQLLVKALKNDHVNLGRLFTIQNKLRKDALPEQRIIECIMQHTDLMFELFVDFAKIASGEKKPEMNKEISAKVQKVLYDSLDRSIFESFLIFNSSLMKTNFYKFEKAAISYRLNPAIFLANRSYPEVPFGLFLVVGSDFTGFHVRFRDVARGGIRIIKSPNPQAFLLNQEGLFSEVYNLANTQQRKNKDIPEGGSKGTILLSPDAQNNVVGAFQKYVDSMLDLLLKQKDVYDHLGQEEILFFGPDENTAHVMDWAALHSKSRGYKFWKAFTTGKSPTIGGIPHDVYAMTTIGVHEYVLGIYDKLHLDESKITKVCTGGPDGDLGGNEILISKDKTICIIDGSGVLYDPEGLNRAELARLVKDKSMINEYKAKLGPKGFMVLIDENDKKLPSGEVVESGISFRNNFHLHPEFTADLFIPCGGRPSSVNVSNVQQFFKEDKKTPKVKYVVEGANLFFTQDARLILEEAGVILFKDASSNKGGVTSSSMEVLAALAFSDEEFQKEMCENPKTGEKPKFYQDYVQEVIKKVRHNARMEFECIWKENEKTKVPRCKLSDDVSSKINTLNDQIKASSLWNDKDLVKTVMMSALPKLLLDRLGLETILKRVPDIYLKSIFSNYIASHFVYQYGLSAAEFDFFDFMQSFLKTGKQTK